MINNLKNKFSGKEIWQRNLIVLWFGTFMTGIGGSLIAPFISLYIATLGHYTTKELAFWSGAIFASNYIVLAIVSPLWGRLADAKGRKLMLLRASAGMAVTIFLMGFVTHAWMLLALRMLLGAFSGFTSNSMALMATTTPKTESGRVMSTLTTGSVGGMLLGPIIGGVVVGIVGYRPVFWITGVIMAAVFFLALFFVKEDFKPIIAKGKLGMKEVFTSVNSKTIVWGMLLTTAITQITNQSINPVLSLYVKHLMHDTGNITLMAGVVSAAPGIVTLLVAPRLGQLGDHIGQKYILGAGLVFSMLVFIGMSFATNVYYLIGTRLLIGVSDAAILPSVQAVLAKQAPQAVTGRVFSYNQSAQSMGAFIGPLIGSTIAAMFGYNMVFIGSAIFVVINLINYATHTKDLDSEVAA
ncbi:MFS transporter [Periweissella cryptocerci]|uniref:MFS transporter n=1 Tax=Periweissella cryptocerci TaxID=2506420 RepID=A0A4P6YVH2_9LACO|nr:MFS transporter [Periweissella cryptocerci]QBO36849.1 MFS transporter [Periweissella cryptocerci]